MAIDRETVMDALLALLGTATANGVPFTSKGRRLRDPENVPSNDRPALFVVEHIDNWERQSVSLPARTELKAWAIIYSDVGTDENLIPMTQLNQFIQAFEALLQPDNPIVGRCTLGGLVYSCMLKGEGIRAAGDTTGKSLCAAPIEIIFP